MLSSQICVEFTQQWLSVLKFKELLKQPALFSWLLSVALFDKDEMWFEKDMVKDSRGGMCFQKTLFTMHCAHPAWL